MNDLDKMRVKNVRQTLKMIQDNPDVEYPLINSLYMKDVEFLLSHINEDAMIYQQYLERYSPRKDA